MILFFSLNNPKPHIQREKFSIPLRRGTKPQVSVGTVYSWWFRVDRRIFPMLMFCYRKGRRIETSGLLKQCSSIWYSRLCPKRNSEAKAVRNFRWQSSADWLLSLAEAVRSWGARHKRTHVPPLRAPTHMVNDPETDELIKARTNKESSWLTILCLTNRF